MRWDSGMFVRGLLAFGLVAAVLATLIGPKSFETNTPASAASVLASQPTTVGWVKKIKTITFFAPKQPWERIEEGFYALNPAGKPRFEWASNRIVI